MLDRPMDLGNLEEVLWPVDAMAGRIRDSLLYYRILRHPEFKAGSFGSSARGLKWRCFFVRCRVLRRNSCHIFLHVELTFGYLCQPELDPWSWDDPNLESTIRFFHML